jgi:hypothetical protein
VIYVIQEIVNGHWEDVRFPDGQPMWFMTRRQANIERVNLGPGRWLRVIQVKD